MQDRTELFSSQIEYTEILPIMKRQQAYKEFYYIYMRVIRLPKFDQARSSATSTT